MEWNVCIYVSLSDNRKSYKEGLALERWFFCKPQKGSQWDLELNESLFFPSRGWLND
jgi:hypothetical protein